MASHLVLSYSSKVINSFHGYNAICHRCIPCPENANYLQMGYCYNYICSHLFVTHPISVSSKETFLQYFLEILKFSLQNFLKMFHLYYTHIELCNRFNSSSTHYCFSRPQRVKLNLNIVKEILQLVA